MARRDYGQLGLAFRPRRLRLEVLEERRMLAVVTVDTALDTVDLGDGLTSLREAIFATNLVAGADTIEFDASLSGQTILLTMGELAITDSLTIDARGWPKGSRSTPAATTRRPTKTCATEAGYF